jgi:D-alanyl-D-alanine carboxypeptidase (penicillin-binding protein 5/6)
MKEKKRSSMVRRVFAVILLLLAMVLLIGVGGVLGTTPVGTRVLSSFGTPTPTPKPILTLQGTPPAVGAKAAYLLDADTGHALVNINGQQRLPMASTTKIMTALIALQMADLQQVVTVQQDAVNEVKKNQGSSAFLVVGDKIRMIDLLYALMLPSGDDAAITIADGVAGSPAKFVDIMNLYAQRMQLKQTHYINPDGLTYLTAQNKPDPQHYTSAADLVQLTRVALSNPLFAQIVALQEYKLPATAEHHAYDWTTTDNLLSGYPGALGVKTGFTAEAGYCLVFSATNGGHHLIGVLLNDSTQNPNVRFTDAGKLLDWGFALPLRPPPTPVAQ